MNALTSIAALLRKIAGQLDQEFQSALQEELEACAREILECAKQTGAPAAQGDARPLCYARESQILRVAKENGTTLSVTDEPCGYCVVPLYTTPQPSAPGVVSDAMVQRFLAWELLTDARQQSGGPGTVNADEARTLLQHVLFGATTAQPSADDAPDTGQAVREAWRAAITLGNNICAQESDDENGIDGDVGWISGTARCAERIREYAEPSDEALRVMLAENGAIAAIAALAAPPADARDAVAETRTTICGQCSETVPLPADPHHYCAACCRADSERLDHIASEYLSLRPIKAGMGTGWQLLNHDASAVIAEVHIDDPRSCIDVSAHPQSAWPECSGDPACCPENEGHGCCKPNPAGHTTRDGA